MEPKVDTTQLAIDMLISELKEVLPTLPSWIPYDGLMHEGTFFHLLVAPFPHRETKQMGDGTEEEESIDPNNCDVIVGITPILFPLPLLEGVTIQLTDELGNTLQKANLNRYSQVRFRGLSTNPVRLALPTE